MKNALLKFFHLSIGRLISHFKQYAYQYMLRGRTGYFEVSVKPKYLSQLAGSESKLIHGFYGQIQDKLAAKRFGAANLEEFSYWAWRSCGIIGLQMVISTLGSSKEKLSTMDLIKEGLTYGGYNRETDTGWYHSALVRIAEKRGFISYTEKFVPPAQIAAHVLQNDYVLASLWSKTGGHLVLIYGVELKKGVVTAFTTHDPNDFIANGNSRVYPVKEFNQLSTRRTIVFKRKV